MLIHVLFIPKPKSSNSSNHIPLLDIDIDHNDSVKIFQYWSYKGDNFYVKIFHDPIPFGDCKNVNKKEVIKCGFLDNPQYLLPDFDSYTLFPEPPIEEKSSLLKSLKEVIEAQKQFEKMVASSCPPNFQNSCSSFPEPVSYTHLTLPTIYSV